jgi:hypothetical protein
VGRCRARSRTEQTRHRQVKQTGVAVEAIGRIPVAGRIMKPFFCGTALALVIAAAAPAWAADPAASPQSALPSSPAAPEAAASASPPIADHHADHLAVVRAEPRKSRRSARREAATGFVKPGLVKPGLWEFTAELQPADPPPYEAGKPVSDTAKVPAAKTTYTSCIAAENAVPAALGPQCQLDRSERQGARVTWWMSCPDRQVQAEGVALYAGDAMNATMISHLHGVDGAVTDIMQNIAGRYLGPCHLQAEMPPMPFPPGGPPGASPELTGAAAPPSAPPSSEPALAASPDAAALTGTTAPRSAASAPPAPEQAAAPPPARPEARRHRRHARGGHHRHRHAHRSSRRAWSVSASRPFGPSPNAGGGY